MNHAEMIEDAEAKAIDDLTLCAPETLEAVKRFMRPGEIDAFVTLAVLTSSDVTIGMTIEQRDTRNKRYHAARRIVNGLLNRYIYEARHHAIPRCQFSVAGPPCDEPCDEGDKCAGCGRWSCAGHREYHRKCVRS